MLNLLEYSGYTFNDTVESIILIMLQKLYNFDGFYN